MKKIIRQPLFTVKTVATDFLPMQKIHILRAFASLTSSYRARFLELIEVAIIIPVEELVVLE